MDNFCGAEPSRPKHGRFSLLASFGDFVREYTKLGSYLPPSIKVLRSAERFGRFL